MVIITLIFLTGSYFFKYTFIETSYSNNIPTGKRTNKNDMSSFWVNFLIVGIFTFFENKNQWILIFSLFILSLWELIYYLKELPDYNYEIIKLKILKHSIFFWSSICLLFLKLIHAFITFDSGIIVFFLGCPIIIIIIYFKLSSPLSHLLIEPSKLSLNDFLQRIKILLYLIEKYNNRDSQLILISYALKIENNCPLEHCPLKIFLEFRKDSNKSIIALIEYIDSLFLMAISKFPKDINLRINYILFLISKMNNKIKAAQQLDYCDKIYDKTLEEDFIVYRYKKQYEKNCEFNFHDEKIEEGNFLLFKNKFKLFKTLITKVSILYVEFWSLLFKNHLEHQQDFHSLNKYGSQINNLITEINSLFSQLRKIKKQDVELLELYYEFLYQIMSDNKQSSEIHKEIESIIINPKNNGFEFNKEYFDLNTLITDDMNFYLIFNANIGKFGIIIHVSNDICSFLGYNQNELIGNSINLLIPEIFQKEHNKIVLENTTIHTEQKNDFSNSNIPGHIKRNVYAITKSRYLIPFNFRTFFIQTDARDNLWILKVSKFTSYFSSNENNSKGNLPFIVLTNDIFIIQNFSGNCIQLFGNKFSNLINSCDITSFIKEFHEEYLRFSVENENHSYEERLKIKRHIIKINYQHPTQITWIKTIQNGEEIEKRKEILLLTVKDLVFEEKIKGYIFEFDNVNLLNSSSSSRSNSTTNNKKTKYKKKNSVFSNFNDNIESFFKKKKNINEEKFNNFIEPDFLPIIPNEKGIEFIPKEISYKLIFNNENEKIDYLKNKAMKKINENNIYENSKNSEENVSKLSDDYSSDYLSDSNSEEENELYLKKELNKSNRSDNGDYYHINFQKINYQIFNFQNNRFEDVTFEKKSLVQQILDKDTINSPKKDNEENNNNNNNNGIIHKTISYNDYDKEEKIKKENLFQLISDSLLKVEVPNCIIKLKIISFIIFLIIISYGLLFLLLIKNFYQLLDKKYINIKQTFDIQTGSVHGLKLIREIILLSFEQYDNFYMDKEEYKKNYTQRLINLYLSTNNFISDLSIKTSGLSEKNFNIIFETILPTYFINVDYNVGLYNLTFISTISKSITSLFAISELTNEELIPLNLNVFFYMRNTLNGILIDIDLCQKTYINEFNDVIKKRKKNLIIVYIISSIILLSTFLIIYNIFMEVQSTKNSYLEVFFEIKGNVILTYLNKCEIFTKKIQSLNDNGFLFDDDSEKSEMNKNKLRKANNNDNQIKGNEYNNSNQKISLITTTINIIFFSMQVLVVIYILIILLILFNFIQNLKQFIMVYSHESKLQTNTILLYICVREYLFDFNTLVSNNNIYKIIDFIFENHIKAKKEIQNEIRKYQHIFRKDYSEFRYSVFHSDICNYTTDFFNEFYPNNDNYNCYSLLDGSAQFGLSLIMSNLFEELRIMKAQIDNYEKIWKENNLIYNLTLFGTKNYISSNNFTDENTRLLYKKYSPLTLFNMNEMKEMEMITEYLLIPILVKLREKLDESVQDYFNDIKIITYSMCIIIIFFLLYYILLCGQVMLIV